MSENTNAEENSIESVLPSDNPEFKIPEKFEGKTAEEIAKAYVELEKFKEKKDNNSEGKTEGEGGDPKTDDNNPAPNEGKISEENYNKYLEKYNSEDGLTEEDYIELNKLGISKEDIDKEVEYRTLKAEKEINEVLEPFGGKAKFDDLVVWAKDNLGEDELNNINEDLSGSSVRVQQRILRDLFNQKEASETSSQTYHSNTNNTSRNTVYASREEFLKDKSDPRFKRDSEYRELVTSKMMRSNRKGWGF